MTSVNTPRKQCRRARGSRWQDLAFPACPQPGCQMAGPPGASGCPGGRLPFSVLQAGCKALWEPVYTRAANCTLEVVRDPINCPEVGGSWEAREQCWPVQGGLLPLSGAAFHRAMAFLGGPAQGRGGQGLQDAEGCMDQEPRVGWGPFLGA